MKLDIKEWSKISSSERAKFFKRSEIDISEVQETVAAIIDNVRHNGDKALSSYTEQFDKADISNIPLLVGQEEYDRAEDELDIEVKDAIRYAIENVTKFHAQQKPEGMNFMEIRPGVFAGERALPVPSAGLYVPRGRGSFPSMLYMLAIPAVIAGVEDICIVTPPNEDGTVDKGCLFAAMECGIPRIYRVGGAQAIAALAYGTESIPPVSKIVGPGSMYVTAAKRIVAQSVDIGLPAGPSESMIIADDGADPRKIVIDLLTEAEHGSDSSAVLVTTSRSLAEKTVKALPGEIEQLPEPRKTFVRDVFQGYGAVVLVDDMDELASLVNEFAPEHLMIQCKEPFDVLSLIRNAGEIILGENTPFSAANYLTGANAVLPTGGKAKTFSAVSVRDFIKYSSVIYSTAIGYEGYKEHVKVLSDYEGFAAHKNAVVKR
ncbi:MAG: histidinol dehydrogenase [Spirochaetales bacterium]|nr:histidinol dehydrogenase [Spirochaetales bacterium]